MKTTVMFKTDKKLKEASQKMAKKMGIPFPAVRNQVLREIVNREQITFSAQEYEPTPYLRRILEQGEKNLAEGKVKIYNSLKEMRIALDK